MAKHVCANQFTGDGAKGACYFEIAKGPSWDIREGAAHLSVGWSCVRVFDGEIPISWLAELVAIASGHPKGIGGFLAEHDYGNPSYALMCDPEAK